MEKYFTKKQFTWIGIAIMLALFSSIFILWNVHFPYDDNSNFGSLHIGANIVIVITLIAFAIYYSFTLSFDEDSKKKYPFRQKDEPLNGNNTAKFISSKTKVYFYSIILLLIGYIFVLSPMVKLYNTNQENIFSSNAIKSEKKIFYDKLWKTFIQKENITTMSKDVFINITKIIMDDRSDGAKITWKWVSENQPIPYEEYTKFYADLSTFITEQREGYYQLEKKANEIAMANNLMLSKFPNNIYNVILGCKTIEYQQSISSDNTEKVFQTNRENL